jgi:hypothetical protein
LSTPSINQQQGALDRLVDREEVLQICYWYQGEGLGDIYNPVLLGPFLNRAPDAIEAALQRLAQLGYLEPVSLPAPGYRLTADGKKQAGRLFAESFADFQKSGHGECDAGCCDGDDHSKCGDDCTLH